MIYDIAGLRIDIKNRCAFTAKFCENYLSPDQNAPADLSAEVTNEAFFEEKQNSPNFSDGYIENICLYRNICSQIPILNRFLLHAAILEYDGKGYAFLGRSGTGKSTHTGLWLKYLPSAFIVNGDKPILQFTEDGFYAYGTPWMGKEGLGRNVKTKLNGLCFLEQAKTNAIRSLSPQEVSQRLFSQILLPQREESVVATLELADKLIQSVPAYLLQCDISEEAVITSFEEMTKTSYPNHK